MDNGLGRDIEILTSTARMADFEDVHVRIERDGGVYDRWYGLKTAIVPNDGIDQGRLRIDVLMAGCDQSFWRIGDVVDVTRRDQAVEGRDLSLVGRHARRYHDRNNN